MPDTDTPRLPGVILVPMRDEEAVAGPTLDRLATSHHPAFRVMPIVDHADDPGTARIVHKLIRDVPPSAPCDASGPFAALCTGS